MITESKIANFDLGLSFVMLVFKIRPLSFTRGQHTGYGISNHTFHMEILLGLCDYGGLNIPGLVQEFGEDMD